LIDNTVLLQDVVLISGFAYHSAEAVVTWPPRSPYINVKTSLNEV